MLAGLRNVTMPSRANITPMPWVDWATCGLFLELLLAISNAISPRSLKLPAHNPRLFWVNSKEMSRGKEDSIQSELVQRRSALGHFWVCRFHT